MGKVHGVGAKQDPLSLQKCCGWDWEEGVDLGGKSYWDEGVNFQEGEEELGREQEEQEETEEEELGRDQEEQETEEGDDEQDGGLAVLHWEKEEVEEADEEAGDVVGLAGAPARCCFRSCCQRLPEGCRAGASEPRGTSPRALEEAPDAADPPSPLPLSLPSDGHPGRPGGHSVDACATPPADGVEPAAWRWGLWGVRWKGAGC